MFLQYNSHNIKNYASNPNLAKIKWLPFIGRLQLQLSYIINMQLPDYWSYCYNLFLKIAGDEAANKHLFLSTKEFMDITISMLPMEHTTIRLTINRTEDLRFRFDGTDCTVPFLQSPA